MTNKFRYPIFPDRTYTLEYEFGSIEVKGEDILAMFHRGAYLDKVLSELWLTPNKLSTDNPLPGDLNTPEN